MDGGSENTARAVFLALEHLVSKGLCPLIVYTRLPVGHTHEDIDSRFGKIWVYIRQRHVYTPQQFESHVLAALGNRESVRVIAVMAIYDYKVFYDKYIDKTITIGTGMATYLQWKFERANLSVMQSYQEQFPNSVKVQYRKLAQDRATLLYPCDCRDGSALVYTTNIIISSWQPVESIDSAPGISFASRPFEENDFPTLQPFQPGSCAEFANVRRKIGFTHFVGTQWQWVREAWDEFALTMPKTDNVDDFNDDHPIVLPINIYGNLTDRLIRLVCMYQPQYSPLPCIMHGLTALLTVQAYWISHWQM